MSTQAPFVLDDAVLAAWRSFLRAHHAIVRRLDADLVAEHGMTLNDYEVLLYPAQAPGRRLRMSELADRVLLTRSGVTRLVDGLERSGLVCRCWCPADAKGLVRRADRRGPRRPFAEPPQARRRCPRSVRRPLLGHRARDPRRAARGLPGADLSGGCV